MNLPDPVILFPFSETVISTKGTFVPAKETIDYEAVRIKTLPETMLFFAESRPAAVGVE